MFGMLPLKFLVVGDEIRFARVKYHKDLLRSDEEKSLVKGGGQWRINKDEKTIEMFGSSYDFGYSRLSDVKEMIYASFENRPNSLRRMESYTIYYFDACHMKTKIYEPKNNKNEKDKD